MLYLFLLLNILHPLKLTSAEEFHHIYVPQIYDTLNAKFNQDGNNNKIKDYNNDPQISDLIDQLLATQLPNLHKSCARRSLSRFIPLCLNKHGTDGVSDSQRVKTAIELSICEFEASGLDQLIPYECLDSRDPENGTLGDIELIMQCLLSRLELRGEWWSTYTGYYQRLDELCLSYALPFQKDDMINTFVNTSKFMGAINEFWASKFDKIVVEVDREMETHLRKVNEIAFKIWRDLGCSEEEIRARMVQFGEDLEEIFDMGSIQMNRTLVALDNLLLLKINSINDRFESILAKLDSDTRLEEKLETLQNSSITSLELALKENALSLIGFQNDVLENELGKIAETLTTFIENQLQTLDTLKEFDSVAHNVIDRELIPQLNELRDTVFTNWLSMSDVISQEMKLWNKQVFQNFNTVSEKLNCTLTQVNQLEAKIDKIGSMFRWIAPLFNGSMLSLKYSLVSLMAGIVLLLGSSFIPFQNILAHFIAKPSIILLAIYMGRLLGSFIRNFIVS